MSFFNVTTMIYKHIYITIEQGLFNHLEKTVCNYNLHYAEDDNNKIIATILKLRKERVGLMGYDNFAEWRLQRRREGD